MMHMANRSSKLTIGWIFCGLLSVDAIHAQKRFSSRSVHVSWQNCLVSWAILNTYYLMYSKWSREMHCFMFQELPIRRSHKLPMQFFHMVVSMDLICPLTLAILECISLNDSYRLGNRAGILWSQMHDTILSIIIGNQPLIMKYS